MAVVTSVLRAPVVKASASVYTNSGSCIDDTYVVPAGIHQVHIIAIGGAGTAGLSGADGNGGLGNGGAGGQGSKIATTVSVTPGQTLYVNVAAPFDPTAQQGSGYGGIPGGGTFDGPVNIGGPGGSASWVTNADPTGLNNTCAPSLFATVVVAAGGGGGGGAGNDDGGGGGTETVNAGHGGDGGSNGEDDGAGGSGGAISPGFGTGGAGGHNSGVFGCINGTAGGTGGFLQGGFGGDAGSDTGGKQGCQGEFTASGSGGGGGGGLYSGGGGGGADDNRAAGGGGGAGHSYTSGTLDTAIKSTTESPSVSIEPVFTAPSWVSTTGTVTTTVGGIVNFTLTAAGYPLPSIRPIGSWPSNVFFDDNRNGTVTISGSPGAFSGGTYNFTLIAENHDAVGNTHAANLPYTIVVDETPDIYSDNSVYFNIGQAGSFTVKSQLSYPPNPAITETGALPGGVTFTDNHNGTATLAGTPATGSGGFYNFTIRATNTAGQQDVQAFTLTVYPVPMTLTVHSSSNPSAVGGAVTFSATLSQPIQTYVRFSIDGSQYAFVLSGLDGVASAPPTSALSAGSHTISATTSGDSLYTAASGSLTQHVQVLSGKASGITLSTSPQQADNIYFQSRNVNTTFRTTASGTSAIGNPNGFGIAVDPAGDIYSFGYDPSTGAPQPQKQLANGSVQLLGPSGQLGAYVEGLAIDAQGDVFINENGFSNIDEVTASGTLKELVSNQFGQYYNLVAVAADPAGDVFFADQVLGKVWELPPPYTGTPIQVASGLSVVTSLATDAKGDLFIGDEYANKVIEVPAGGLPTTLITGISPLSLAVDSPGNLYVGTATGITEFAPPYTGAGTVVVTGHEVDQMSVAPPTLQITDHEPLTLNTGVISSPAGTAPAGTVTFFDGSTSLGTVTLNGSSPDAAGLSLPAGLSIGTHVYTATYNGSAAFPASTSFQVPVTVVSSRLPITVTGSQSYLGTPAYAFSSGTLPAGITGVSGSLSGCGTTVTATTDAGHYNGTISGCGGLSLAGPSAPYYVIAYVDGGFTVNKDPMSVTIRGTQPYLGSPTFSYQVSTPPSGISGATGTLTGCHTTVATSAAVGSYPSTISGCSGLTPTGPTGIDYFVTYANGGYTVTPAPLTVTVTGSQPYLGSPAFVATPPATLPSGVTSVAGTLAGCATTVTAQAAAGTYQGTISGCGGYSVSGPNSADYSVAYHDGGFSVTPLPLAVTVTGTQPFGGLPTFVYGQPASPPPGVTGATGAISGCVTTVDDQTPVGTYPDTISGCTGVSATGPNGADYSITYTDGGFTVSASPTGTSLAISPADAPDLYVTEKGVPAKVVRLASPYNSAGVALGSGWSSPRQVAADSHGNVYVADDTKRTIVEVKADGTQTTVGTGLLGPQGVAVDTQGDVFIADTSNQRVVEVTAGGIQTTLVSGLYYPDGLAVDSAGDLFISVPNGSVQELLPPYTGGLVPVATGIVGNPSPNSVAVGPDGTLYIAAGNNGPFINGKIEVATPPFDGSWTTNGSGPLFDPEADVMDSAGNLWITDLDGRLYELNGTGYHLVNGSIAAPYGVAAGSPTSNVFQGALVTFTATVISSPPGGTPTGTVTFSDGATTLGTADLNGGAPDTATFSTTSLSVGTHQVTATYGGVPGFPASTSTVGTVVVSSPIIDIGVSGSQSFGGSTNFAATPPALLPPGITLTGSLSGCTSTVSATSDVSTYFDTISGCGGLDLTGANSGLYSIAYVDNGVTVTPLPLSVGITGSQVYGGGPTFAAGLPDLPDGITGVLGNLTGCQTSVQSGADTGTYSGTITGCGGMSLIGPASGDYQLNYADNGFTVTPAAVDVPVTATQVYGGSPQYSADTSGLPSGLSTSGTLADCGTSLTASASVGVYPNAISGCDGLLLTGSKSADYSILYTDGQLTVSAATLTVTPDAQSITYGDPEPAFSFGITGYQNGQDAAALSTLPACGVAGSHSGVGQYTIACTGGSATNYTFDETATAKLTIGSATLTVTPDNQSKIAGQSDPTFTYSVTGFQNGDKSGVITTAPTCGVAAAHSTVGQYTIACSGGVAPNYVFDDTATATLTVSPAAVNVSVSGSQTYGGSSKTFSFSAPGYTLGGTLSCGTVDGGTAINGALAVGSHTIDGSSCSGLTPPNGYALHYVGVANGFVVGKATLTVTADNKTKLFGAPNPALTATITGFVNSQTLGTSGVTGTPACTTTALPASPGGQYPITCTAGSLSSANYNFSFKSGTLTVNYTKRITGTVKSVTVKAGDAVLVAPGTKVTGSVGVTGGSLDIEGAQIGGPINSTGAQAMRICGTFINSSTWITKTADDLIMGDDDGPSACAGNTTNGAVYLINNLGGVEFDQNMVNGSLTITGNTGSLPAPDTGTVDVVGNKVTGTVKIQT